MEQPPNSRPMFNGMPVMVRLLGGDDVACVAYKSDVDTQIHLERPLLTFPMKDKKSNTIIRFQQWMLYSEEPRIPVYADHVITIVPLAPAMMNAYIEWADEIYKTDDEDPDEDPIPTPTVNSPEDVKQAYYDFLLESFVPKGKPH